MVYTFIRLFGTREEQKAAHRALREPVVELHKAGIVARYVLTYHYGKGEADSLYLCLDLPSITDCTRQVVLQSEALEPITDYIRQFWHGNKVKVEDYEVAVQMSKKREIMKAGIENPSPSLVQALTETQIDNASRGSMAALRILSEDPDDIADWFSLALKVYEYCRPINGGWVLSGTDHFCYNSLGIGPDEEKTAKGMAEHFMVLNRMTKRLFERESWSARSREDKIT